MIDYALASVGVINNILDINIEVKKISTHVLLLLELKNTTEDTNNNTKVTYQTQIEKLRYNQNS
jgi:hypothetical protein